MPTNLSPIRRATLAVAVALAVSVVAACGEDAASSDSSATSTAATGSTGPASGASDLDPPAPDPASLGPAADDQSPPVGTNGMAFDADGRLWIADLAGDQLLAVDPADGAILVRLGADHGVNAPDDLAFDTEGSLWWTDNEAGQVGRIVEPLAPTAQSAMVADIGSGANPIAFDADGKVAVARALNGDQLLTLDPDAADENGVIRPEVVIDEPGHLNGFAFGEDGLLYSPRNADDGSVVTVDLSSGEVTEITGGLPLTVSTKVAPDGRLWVLTVGPTQVLRVDPADGATEVYAELPGAIADNQAIDGHGTLWVSAFNEPLVWRIDDGEAIPVNIGE